MVFCSNCGISLPEGARFCSKCGTEVGGGAAAPEAGGGSSSGGGAAVGRSAGSSPIPKKNLNDLVEQLTNMGGDRDRIRLVTAAADGWSFTCEQVAELVKVQCFGEAKTLTGSLLYPKVVDPENFEKQVIDAYDFEEDKQDVRNACGL